MICDLGDRFSLCVRSLANQKGLDAMTDIRLYRHVFWRVFVFLSIVTVASWVAQFWFEDLTPITAVLIVATVCACIVWLMCPRTKRELPDILGELHSVYFESDGLCFAPSFVVVDGLCWCQIICQNRYARICSAKVMIVPMEGMSKNGEAHEVPPVVAEFNCEGGEVGRIRIPYPIATHWQEKIMIYDVYAQSFYPRGTGNLMRSKEGLEVGAPPHALFDVLRPVGLMMLGKYEISNTASIELRLPENVRDSIPPDVDEILDTIWELEEPAEAAPVAKA